MGAVRVGSRQRCCDRLSGQVRELGKRGRIEGDREEGREVIFG